MVENDNELNLQEDITEQEDSHQIRSLRDLIDLATGRDNWGNLLEEDAGILETLPFPFLAIVGQPEMKLALLLSLINPSIGGVLLIGPRGTGKTTAVRSLVDLLPQVPRSLCYYGCMPEDIESGGIDSVCQECIHKYAIGEPLAAMDSVRLVELPLNARLDDVVGGLDERSAIHSRFHVRRGILAQADKNILYIDEVNLLSDDIVDVILDAAAQGAYTLRRGPVSASYRSRFILIGSMNPEEGSLRPQIMDRFGLRVYMRGLQKKGDRFEAYNRVREYIELPRKVIQQYRVDTELARNEIQNSRALLPEVILSQSVAQMGLQLIEKLKIDSLRAEITLFEAARAYAAFDNRNEVIADDMHTVAMMALRMRRSKFIEEFTSAQKSEEDEIKAIADNIFNDVT